MNNQSSKMKIRQFAIKLTNVNLGRGYHNLDLDLSMCFSDIDLDLDPLGVASFCFCFVYFVFSRLFRIVVYQQARSLCSIVVTPEIQ